MGQAREIMVLDGLRTYGHAMSILPVRPLAHYLRYLMTALVFCFLISLVFLGSAAWTSPPPIFFTPGHSSKEDVTCNIS